MRVVFGVKNTGRMSLPFICYEEYAVDPDKYFSDADFTRIHPLSEIRSLIEKKGTIHLWREVADADTESKKKIKESLEEASPYLSDIIFINDSDGYVNWWDKYDNRTIELIGKVGSIHACIQDDHISAEFNESRGLKMSLAYLYKHRGGSQRERILKLFKRFHNMAVVGKTCKEFDNHRCMKMFNLHVNPHAHKDFYKVDRRAWMTSMFDLARGGMTNCFLCAEIYKYDEYTLDEYRKMFDEVFPQLSVIYRDGSLTFNVRDFDKLE